MAFPPDEDGHRRLRIQLQQLPGDVAHLGPGRRPRRILGPPLGRHIRADHAGSSASVDHRACESGDLPELQLVRRANLKTSFRNSKSVPSNRGRYRPRRQGLPFGTRHVEVTPGEANVTWRKATGELGRTGGVAGEGDATPSRRFSPHGAPSPGFPQAGCRPLPSSWTPRRPTGRAKPGPRRRGDQRRRPPVRSSVEGRCSARLPRRPAAFPSTSCNQGHGVRLSNICGTTRDLSGPFSELRALLRTIETRGTRRKHRDNVVRRSVVLLPRGLVLVDREASGPHRRLSLPR